MTSKTPKRITVIRAPHDADRPYFLHSRDTAQDRELTWEARGVVSYLLSKPPDWEVNPKDLQQLCGRDKVYKILNELIEHSYMLRYMEANKRGQYTKVVYELHERPLPENPEAAKPDTDLPDTANTDTNIIESLESTDSTDQEKQPVTPPDDPKPERPRDPWFDNIATICGYDPDRVPKGKGSSIGKAKRELVEAEWKPEDVLTYYEWRKAKGYGTVKGAYYLAEAMARRDWFAPEEAKSSEERPGKVQWREIE